MEHLSHDGVIGPDRARRHTHADGILLVDRERPVPVEALLREHLLRAVSGLREESGAPGREPLSHGRAHRVMGPPENNLHKLAFFGAFLPRLRRMCS